MFGRKEFTRLKSPIESKDTVSKNDIDKFKKIVPPNLRVFYRIFLLSKYLYFYGESENLYPLLFMTNIV
jgi:hypothetical protein